MEVGFDGALRLVQQVGDLPDFAAEAVVKKEGGAQPMWQRLDQRPQVRPIRWVPGRRSGVRSGHLADGTLFSAGLAPVVFDQVGCDHVQIAAGIVELGPAAKHAGESLSSNVARNLVIVDQLRGCLPSP